MRSRILQFDPVLEWHRPLLKALLPVLALVFTLTTASAQTLLKGTIVDENKAPMPGVSILIKGTSSGTTTDADGHYALEIPAGSESAVIVISFIGYQTEEQALNGRTTIDLTLTPSIQALSEVVVVGYGTQKKTDVTGSMVSVKASDLAEVPVANMQQALQGRAAGVEVQTIGTAPGATARIRIRGDRSISGSNDPLIVLDGIPYDGSLSDINQDDIATIDVLKDASATAIYGSRGANGVILVTTKRGKSGETRLTLNSYVGTTSVARKYKLFNGEEYAAMRDASSWPYGYMPEEVQGQAIGRNTDWQNLMYQKGYMTDTNLGITGGTEATQFNIGGGYLKQTTILPGQDFSRYSLRAAVDTKIGKRLKIGLNTMNTMSTANGSQFVNQQPDTPGAFGGSIMYNILATSPLMPAYNADGSVFKQPFGNNDDKAANYSPLLLKHNNNDWVDKIRRIRSFNTLFAEYQIIDGLKYRLNVGADFNQQNSAQFVGADSYFRVSRGNTAQVRNAETFAWTAENMLTYEKTIAEKHHITFTGLYSAQQSRMYSTQVRKDSITTDFIQFYNMSLSKSTAPIYLDGSEETWGIVSYMARMNYSFNDRYLVTLTYRKDGSSRLADKWHQYPAVAVGWNVMNESFMNSIGLVTNLKVRAGYGQTSNQAVPVYTTLGGVSNIEYTSSGNFPIKYNYGSQHVSGYLASRIPDKTLDWEYTNTVNIGVDYGVLNNRVTGTIDWYQAKTNNLLYSSNLPYTSGYQEAYLTNIGKMENKGLELAMSTVNLKMPGGFTWSTDVNWFYNRNKITALSAGVKQDIGNGLFVGQPMTALYDYKKLGIWQTGEATDAATFGQLPGQLKLADLNSPDGKGPDGKITPEDRTIIGSQQAKWQAGMTNRFAYKGFDLSIVAFARYGGTLISALHGPSAAYLTMLNGQRNGLKVDYWTPTNPTNEFPAASAVLPAGAPTSWSTLQYYDATFVKIRSINLGYTLPRSLVNHIKANSARFYITAQNPFLLFCPYVSKHNGVDPEPTGMGATGTVGTSGNYRTSGSNQNLIISAATPPTRSFLIGVNVSF